jgi:hypothetical protein
MGTFEPEKSKVSMGAHYAQKIVEIESEVSKSFRSSLHRGSALGNMDKEFDAQFG